MFSPRDSVCPRSGRFRKESRVTLDESRRASRLLRLLDLSVVRPGARLPPARVFSQKTCFFPNPKEEHLGLQTKPRAAKQTSRTFLLKRLDRATTTTLSLSLSFCRPPQERAGERELLLLLLLLLLQRERLCVSTCEQPTARGAAPDVLDVIRVDLDLTEPRLVVLAKVIDPAR